MGSFEGSGGFSSTATGKALILKAEFANDGKSDFRRDVAGWSGERNVDFGVLHGCFPGSMSFAGEPGF